MDSHKNTNLIREESRLNQVLSKYISICEDSPFDAIIEVSLLILELLRLGTDEGNTLT
jgi:hypothetical protein